MDLDHAAPATSSDPTDSAAAAVPVVSNDSFESVWVDELRLYWVASGGYVSRLQSCLKADCEHTKLTYMQSTKQVQATVADGRVYWTSGSTFFSCPAEGCQGEPTKVGQDPSAGATPIFAHRDYVYWTSDFDIYRCPAQGCGKTPELVALNASANRLVFDDTRAYWLSSLGISSVPSDGSEPPQLESARAREGDALESLAIGAGYLYWAAGEGVFRCPIPGCSASAPTRLVTADAPITELQIDGSALYWLEANALHSCPLSGCEASLTLTPPKVAPGVWNGWDTTKPYAIDAANLYWIQGLSTPESPLPNRGQSLQKTAK
jgi:hypothetical protein